MFILSPTISAFLYLLRIISAQAVLIGHLVDRQAPFIQNGAVVVFSILSGFLIAYSTSHKKIKGNYAFKEYFIDRFSRIYSIFIPALIFTVLIDAIQIKISPETYLFSEGFNLKTFFTNLLQLQYFPSIAFGSNKPLWTIAVWWWLYMVYGWLFLPNTIASKKKRRLVYWPILMLLLIVPVSNLILPRGTGLTLTWILGVGIYYFLVKFNFKPLNIRINYSLPMSWLKFFADYSLTLYLTHYPLYQLLKNWPPFTVYLICNVIAIVLSQFTEAKYKRVASRLNDL